MLSWTEHEEAAVRDSADEVAVTSADDNDTLAKALNLKNYNPENYN